MGEDWRERVTPNFTQTHRFHKKMWDNFCSSVTSTAKWDQEICHRNNSTLRGNMFVHAPHKNIRILGGIFNLHITVQLTGKTPLPDLTIGGEIKKLKINWLKNKGYWKEKKKLNFVNWKFSVDSYLSTRKKFSWRIRSNTSNFEIMLFLGIYSWDLTQIKLLRVNLVID